MVVKRPLQKRLLLHVIVYIQQLGSENISVENAIILIAVRTIFEKSGGAIAPASKWLCSPCCKEFEE